MALAVDDEHEAVGKPERRIDFNAGALRREASDDAWDRFVAELDRP
ncbi:hypothetical protein JQ615_37460 [Bradyrhizobium jicamae]|uniref:DUF397 domain-containing protein n=1 Tax=Bradyrhizobium jicamae TaxID=280332 RepID=A0ABS5FW33_9BRAD|nr:hypothetical protein [Bradyrhizobium jicamae]MBR0801064.1 hypothetical protein [Bradyrhizobium jicamae]